MNKDFDRSLDRYLDSEEYRAETTGFGTTKQGQAVVRKFDDELAANIAKDRAHSRRRDKEVWRVLRHLDDHTIAVRLLVAGITVSDHNDLGADENGDKNFLDIAQWIGAQFNERGKLGHKIGGWGINHLAALSSFELGDGDILRLTTFADDLMTDAVVSGFKANALLSPVLNPPVDWTQVRKGGLPADHWVKASLIREHHRLVENTVRKAIGTGQAQRVHG